MSKYEEIFKRVAPLLVRAPKRFQRVGLEISAIPSKKIFDNIAIEFENTIKNKNFLDKINKAKSAKYPESPIILAAKGWSKSLFGKSNGQTPEVHRALNATALGHEADEISSMLRPSKDPRGFSANFSYSNSHASPAVLFKEHNIIVSLPPTEEKAKEVMRRLRTLSNQEMRLRHLSGGKFYYGKSPRLSRHAIKRLSEAYRKAMGEI